MKYQPERAEHLKVTNDIIMTPPYLCDIIVKHFYPSGRILEPCCGTGNFVSSIKKNIPSEKYTLYYGDLSTGHDFLDGYWNNQAPFDYIITNPPFSKSTLWLEQCFQTANNVIILITLNHALGLKTRYKLMEKYNFGIKEILILNTPPKPWPQAGFQLGCIHWQKNYHKNEWKIYKYN